jgi:hypothetical protein
MLREKFKLDRPQHYLLSGVMSTGMAGPWERVRSPKRFLNFTLPALW